MHKATGGLIRPFELCATVCEHATGTSGGGFRLTEVRQVNGRAYLLGLGSGERQPILTLYFLATEDYSWTGSVPFDVGHLDVVEARGHDRALRITRDGVEGSAGCINDRGVDDVGAAAREPEFDGWTPINGRGGGIDKSRT